MTLPLTTSLTKIQQQGFDFVDAYAMRQQLLQLDAQALDDWPAFSASWYNMPEDSYMADGGRYRRRRYATLRAEVQSLQAELQPHQPHYQSLIYNRLNGGVARYFVPIESTIMQGASMRALIGYGLRLFRQLVSPAAVHIEVHQFRIDANSLGEGKPTPEGMHRDGVDLVLVTLIDRVNVQSGTTTIHDLSGRQLASFTLTQALDTALVDDRQAMHGVTPIIPIEPGQAAFRDVLVVTYRTISTITQA
ncbi:2OG-Fe dioxygenase family protein [Ampullimonas aquatilis]|uniref:2OG-Fe dioxygenase family protein n=1 Tax=Ampullimonas aquatilis TaxID=1341549 RepID=UPI003C730F3F